MTDHQAVDSEITALIGQKKDIIPCNDIEMKGETMPGVEGRIALVTGAGRGIGRAAAKLLESRGARVMATARSENELKTLGLDYVAADLGTPDGCALAVKETHDRLGPVSILVCNHGIGSAHEQVVWKQASDVWRETLRINLDGPFYLSQMVVKDMIRQRYGRFVFTSSTAGEKAEYAGSAYTTSKHGLLGLMRAISRDAGSHGVTSNAVLPGWVQTSMAEKSAKAEAETRGITPDEVWKERAALYPAGRVATPEEVAQVILFLASEESSGVSGEAITVALGGLV